jgi:uncharacterized protein with PQ loop repeat
MSAVMMMGVFSNIPQIVRLYQKKSANDISLVSASLGLAFNTMWCYYWFYNEKYKLFTCNLFIEAGTFTIVYLIILYRFRKDFLIETVSVYEKRTNHKDA